jgi:hypothetical protein
MIHTFVTFHVLPNKAEEFESVHRRLLELICAKPGCREAKVHRSLADPLDGWCPRQKVAFSKSAWALASTSRSMPTRQHG